MRVGWLQDDHGYIGGAEMTAAEFRAAAPEGVEIVDCPPGGIVGADVYIAHNAVQYSREELEQIDGRVVKYAHDLFLHDFHGSRDWLKENAEWIFCSPAQRERMGLEGPCIPPPLQLREGAAQERSGTVSVAQWRNPGKGAALIVDYARTNPLDVYGPGPFVPFGRGVTYKGEVMQPLVADILSRYERFVFLPIEFEPFCRTVVEAHFAGCEVVVNELIGARYYLEEDPGALQTAREDFWEVVL